MSSSVHRHTKTKPWLQQQQDDKHHARQEHQSQHNNSTTGTRSIERPHHQARERKQRVMGDHREHEMLCCWYHWSNTKNERTWLCGKQYESTSCEQANLTCHHCHQHWRHRAVQCPNSSDTDEAACATAPEQAVEGVTLIKLRCISLPATNNNARWNHNHVAGEETSHEMISNFGILLVTKTNA